MSDPSAGVKDGSRAPNSVGCANVESRWDQDQRAVGVLVGQASWRSGRTPGGTQGFRSYRIGDGLGGESQGGAWKCSVKGQSVLRTEGARRCVLVRAYKVPDPTLPTST